MKLAIDLIACQAESRRRGIGRYSLELTKALAKSRGEHELTCLADAHLPQSFEKLRQIFIQRLPPGRFQPYHHAQVPADDRAHFADYKQIAGSMINHSRQVVAPDMFLTTRLFEGYRNPRVTVPKPHAEHPGYAQAVILYDLIPYIFQDQYLDPNPPKKEWYLDLVDSLKHFDLYLTISEATRQDAIELLDLPPQHVVTIYGAESDFFRKVQLPETQVKQFLNDMGITRPFVFYLGGNDYRKNMLGALEAYATLPKQIIQNHQFVFNDLEDRAVFHKRASELGLSPKDYVTIGHVSDDALLRLYNLCKVFFFPSLYEGFGLPVLEAMACGAPVVTSDVASLPEVMGRDDALFDVHDPEDITATLEKALTVTKFREDLSRYGMERAKQFSWEETGRLAWKAMENYQDNIQPESVFPVPESHSPRPKIAYLSPLPPQKSGISFYSAELLPYLDEYFEIDLYLDPSLDFEEDSPLREYEVHPWQDLLKNRGDYRTVVYQQGNSQFHSHMLGLEKEFPGVTVLHDFYLSHLVQHYHEPQNSLAAEIDYSHGLKANIDYQNDPHAFVWEWPLNWKPLRYSKEIIVHSPYHNALFDEYYGQGWKPRLNVIPQLHAVPDQISGEERARFRHQLDLDESQFVFCSFGFINEAKHIDLLLQAYHHVTQKVKQDSCLLVVGSFLSDSLKRDYTQMVKEYGLGENVKFTGYVSDQAYARYQHVADAAIQLRKYSRGETSRALLGCLSYGIPVIVNAHGTNDDFPDTCVEKISDPVDVDQLINAMIKLQQDEHLRTKLGENARALIKEKHHPRQAAQAYRQVIHRAIRSDDRVVLDPAYRSLAKLGFTPPLVYDQAQAAARNLAMRSPCRILVDVSYTNEHDLNTGIQRVVRKVVGHWLRDDFKSPMIEPVFRDGEHLRRACRFTEELLGLPEGSLGDQKIIHIHNGDILFMLDSSWEKYAQFKGFFKRVRKWGGKVITGVYDLIPILHPEFSDEVMPKVLERWLRLAIQESDSLVCISQTVADQVAQYRQKHQISLESNLEVEYFHLGADIGEDAQPGEPADKEFDVLSDKQDIFLMVSTVEPRKGHDFVLDTFEKLWDQGKDFTLVYAGKIGWEVTELEDRIRSHPQRNQNFYFFEEPSDAALQKIYAQADALITASRAEGFGLPIIEAAHHDLPVIASDIPVFREVGGEGPLYFSLQSHDSLIDALQELSEMGPSQRAAMVKGIDYLTWQESAQRLLDIVLNDQPQF